MIYAPNLTAAAAAGRAAEHHARVAAQLVADHDRPAMLARARAHGRAYIAAEYEQIALLREAARAMSTAGPTLAGLDWVRDVVLPPAIAGSPILRLCSCQWGICGHCEAGRHTQCTTRALREVGRQLDDPETYIVDRRDVLVGPPAHVAVRLTDRRCRWICSCDCPPELHPGLPPAERQPHHAGGNAAALAQATPTRLRATDQPTLPGLGGGS